MQARLKAARQRKRARMGLPPEEEGKIGDTLSEIAGVNYFVCNVWYCSECGILS